MFVLPRSDFLTIDQKQYYYVELGQGFPTIVLLGWSANLDTFPYQLAFKKSSRFLKTNRLIFLHLSNFSKSTFSSTPYSLEDYSRELEEIIQKLNFKKINLIGHSAGGRISIYFTLCHPSLVEHLVLLNTAGLKHPSAPKIMLARAHTYFTKILPLTSHQRSILQTTLQNIYNTDLTHDLSQIQVPTLIIWGKKDNIIHISKAYIFHQNIKNSRLIIHPRLDHSTTHSPTVFKEVFEFINGN